MDNTIAYIDFLSLTDRDLLVYGTRLPKVTPLENELLQRLEQRLEGDDDAHDARR